MILKMSVAFLSFRYCTPTLWYIILDKYHDVKAISKRFDRSRKLNTIKSTSRGRSVSCMVVPMKNYVNGVKINQFTLMRTA
mmetsp:Transcript_5367/g.5850  ORF Transcript_5367/g.5850 Transcript_5367/m.5850 type:complete len:81 (+) Transcript_5367:73-315(+)